VGEEEEVVDNARAAVGRRSSSDDSRWCLLAS